MYLSSGRRPLKALMTSVSPKVTRTSVPWVGLILVSYPIVEGAWEGWDRRTCWYSLMSTSGMWEGGSSLCLGPAYNPASGKDLGLGSSPAERHLPPIPSTERERASFHLSAWPLHYLELLDFDSLVHCLLGLEIQLCLPPHPHPSTRADNLTGAAHL